MQWKVRVSDEQMTGAQDLAISVERQWSVTNKDSAPATALGYNRCTHSLRDRRSPTKAPTRHATPPPIN